MREYFDFVNLETDELVTASGDMFKIDKPDVTTCFGWTENDELNVSIKDKTITNIDMDETIALIGTYN